LFIRQKLFFAHTVLCVLLFEVNELFEMLAAVGSAVEKLHIFDG